MLNRNKTFTTVEIKEKELKINAYRILNNQIISIFDNTFNAQDNSAFLDEYGVIKANSVPEIKKNIAENFKSLAKANSSFENNEVYLVLPSTTYSYTTKKYPFKHDNLTLITTDFVQDCYKKAIKKEQLAYSGSHLQTELMQVRVDGVKYDVKDIFVEGKELEIIFAVKSIYKKVYESHENVVAKAGENVSGYMTNLEALYNSIDRAGKNETDIVVVNWKNDKLEAGLFKSGSFVEYTSIPFGMEYIIESLAKEFGLEAEVVTHYLYNNINFESKNILRSVFLKFKTQFGLRSLTGEEIQRIIKIRVKAKYNEIKESFISKSKIDFNVTPVFNFGLIQEIPNGITLLSNTKSSFDYLNKKNIIGAFKNSDHFVSFGLISNFVNKVIPNEIKNISENNSINPINMQFGFIQELKGQNMSSSHLYLKNDGILIDKVEA
ncbi:hypothetical protein CK556_02225 [Mesoplasma chauliocola]|uniref:Uncharacterized protein n=1 Tax=Mesoplasma chauliocola TaxID=216427 RepID=A0A249SNC4_9MOLU|nr:hypothetical protein [Mesoplasma chauliocola]ASZ09165.1 hypothetical protein CK556_02225 [Mesoplasma chauliocola]